MSVEVGSEVVRDLYELEVLQEVWLGGIFF